MDAKNPRIILYAGVLAVTTSAFIVKYAQQDPYSLAAVRVILTGVISLSFSKLFKYQKLDLTNQEKGLIILSGISLASHFAWWFASLSANIPIGTSLALTNTAPVWIVILSVIIYREKPNAKATVSIILVIIGSAILFISSNTTQLEIEGLIYAIASAIGFAIYLIIAKLLVQKVGMWRYFGLVNITAGISLLPIILLQDKEIIIPDLWIYGMLLALIPGMLGHATYNWAMSRIDQVDVAIATLGEPILGTFFAFIIFREYLDTSEIIGMFFLLSAILLTLISNSTDRNIQN